MDRYLRLTEVRAELGLSKTSLQRLVDEGTFPNAKPMHEGRRNSPWLIPIRDVANYKRKKKAA
jgi:predicted DNA-binding transcriptional regulator AlpA